MTLPTRPAPAPPGSRAQNAAANANASIEQLRLQLQQQQQLQRNQHAATANNVTVPKLTIKLPPPPKQPVTTNNGVANGIGGGSITRKFPQARYAPATNWDDSPFDILAGNNLNGLGGIVAAPAGKTTVSGKKQPPPRPPPPKVLPKKGAAPTPPVQQSTNILTNIFHLKKKSSRAPTQNTGATRAYGSATYGTTTTNSSSTTNRVTSNTTSGILTSSSLTTDWNSAWNTTTTTTTHHAQHSNATTEAQLISFDSPPSSPTFTQKSNSDCLSVDSFSSDSNFSSPNNGSVSQPESGFEDDFSATNGRSRPNTTSPLDPWETLDAFSHNTETAQANTTIPAARYGSIGTAPVRNLSTINTRIQSNGDNPLCNGKSLLPPAPALNMPTIIKPKISQKPKAPKPPPLLAKSSLYFDSPSTPPSPPMPQCAPPPPPPSLHSIATQPTVSILDVITGKADATQVSSGLEDHDSAPIEPPHGIALYGFDSHEEGDLCFRVSFYFSISNQITNRLRKFLNNFCCITGK